MKTQKPRWQWLIWLLLAGVPYAEHFAQAIPTANKGNAPPVALRWYGGRYGLWRITGKPVPIQSTRYRRT